MKAFTRENLEQIRKELDFALANVAAKHDIVISIGNIRFTSDYFTTKLNAKTKTVAVEGTKADVDEVPDFVLKFDDIPLGVKIYPFTQNGRLFTLLGYKKANRRYPYIVKDMKTDKQFKVSKDWFRNIEIKRLVRTK